ncbi:4'-phosphopantetheinyl transferase superfamily protein [Alpinimonas psychrophila]|uniref:Phosphopantetheinyl transferase (Holo-ACP synthase) n=1 Tax=Alpinimonas psychrophila TaxID=748908 RepID=A0A7W3PNW3_9MICO|nr:phosphopantetheinyl transferase (holo-ACP synthase) [Alpinimonas psychrophila]
MELNTASACPRCGATDHGRPSVYYYGEFLPQVRVPVVSLSRTEGLVAVALVDCGIIGIDVESLDHMARADIEDVAFHPAERAVLARLSTHERILHSSLLWTAKESILKAAGTGLNISPELLWCEISGASVTLVAAPDLGLLRPPRVTVRRIGEHHVCAVAHNMDAVTTFSWLPTGSSPENLEEQR